MIISSVFHSKEMSVNKIFQMLDPINGRAQIRPVFPQRGEVLVGTDAEQIIKKRDWLCRPVISNVGVSGPFSYPGTPSWECVPKEGEGVTFPIRSNAGKRIQELAEKLEEVSGKTDLIIII